MFTAEPIESSYDVLQGQDYRLLDGIDAVVSTGSSMEVVLRI
jgi:hypothetical protein